VTGKGKIVLRINKGRIQFIAGSKEREIK
jgi:hypothetical protein